jgi:bifunctional non-homologous end joining protein LigD
MLERRQSKGKRAKPLRATGAAALDEYSAKRAFDATPEPGPAPRAAHGGPLLFVIQQHSARRLHYDFRLECDGVLKSWAVPAASLDPAENDTQTEDHPCVVVRGVIPPGSYGAGK